MPVLASRLVSFSSDLLGSNASVGPFLQVSVTSLSMSTCTSLPSDLLKHSKSLSSSSDSTFQTFAFDAKIIPPSTFRVIS